MTLGEDFTVAEDLTTSTTSSTLYVSKLVLNTPNVVAGDYFVFASMNYQDDPSLLRSDFQARIVEDATTEIANTDLQLESDPGIGDSFSSAMSTMFLRRTLAAGTHSFDLQFRRQAGFLIEAVAIKNVRMMFFNVDGAAYSEASSLARSTTTSTSFQLKVSLNAGALAAGRYLIGFRINYQNQLVTNDCAIRFREVATAGGTTVLLEEAFNNTGFGNTIFDPYQTVAWYTPCRDLAADTYSYELHFRNTVANGFGVTVNEARIVLWKLP